MAISREEYEKAWRAVIQAAGFSEEYLRLTDLLAEATRGDLSETEMYRLLERLRQDVFTDQEKCVVLDIFGEGGFLKAQSDVEAFLEHPDASLRSIALSVLILHWSWRHPKLKIEYSGKCESMFLSDPDLNVRRMAGTCMGFCFQASNDSRVGRVLAEVVRDETANVDLRHSAYKSIFMVRGISPEFWPTIKTRIPDDVDWSLVDSFL